MNHQPAKKECTLWRPWQEYESGANREPEKNIQEGGREREEERGEK